MKRTIVTACVLSLLLLVTVPADGAPSLRKGTQANYNLSASISFLQACNIGPSTSTNMVVCPMIATTPSTVDINGTLGWTVIDLNGTTASLNVTRDLTISNGDAGTSVAHTLGSFAESINLATRITTLLPLIMPEIDQALQMAQTNMATSFPQGANWTSSVSMLDNSMMHRSFYTIWWVNGPIKLNQTIPVLVLPTNATATTSVDLGGTIGIRAAWTLAFNISRWLLSPDPVAASTSSMPLGNNLELAFAFNYDQTSDLLLSASVDIHLGFGKAMTIQPNPCDPSISSIMCPAPSTPITIVREFGIDVQASLKLASTNVDLGHRLTLTGSPRTGNSKSQTSTASGSNPGTSTGGDASSETGRTTSGTGHPTNSPAQQKPFPMQARWMPWVYGILGTVAAAVVGAGIWIARRRTKKTAPTTSVL